MIKTQILNYTNDQSTPQIHIWFEPSLTGIRVLQYFIVWYTPYNFTEKICPWEAPFPTYLNARKAHGAIHGIVILWNLHNIFHYTK